MSARRIVFLILLLAVFSISVFAQPAIVTQSIPSPYVNRFYSQTLQATGGTTPYTWTFVSGNVSLPPPAWLSLSPSGVLSGTPPASAANVNSNFNIQVRDAANLLSPQQPYGFIVRPDLVFNPTTIPNANIGTPITPITFTALGGIQNDVSSGQPAYLWAMAPANVDGLTLGTPVNSNVTLSGTPQLSGKFPFIITVTDANSVTTTHSYVLNASVPLAITTTTLPGGAVGTPYSQGLGATGGLPGYTWSGQIGSGLALSSNGSISGTPTAAGPLNFSASVTDSVGNTAGRSFIINVAASGNPLTVTTTSLPSALIGTAYNAAVPLATLAAAGGTAPYTWALTSGSLPSGLTLNSDGTITGTPAANAGQSSFIATVTDSAKLTAVSPSLSINVSTLNITTTTLPGGTLNTVYPNTQLAAIGGTLAYRWALASGTLPTGLSLGATGILSGTPTAAGTFSFAIQVSDSATPSAVATKAYAITVAAATQSITITPTGTLGPAQQPVASVTLGTAAPAALNGTLTLTFVSSVGGDDQMVRFSNGLRTAPFTIAAGATQAAFGATSVSVITGTVAGTITITAALSSGGVDVTPTPVPTTTIVIAKAVPVITKVILNTNTAGGTFTVAVTGYSTPRDMTTATFHFTAASGTTLAQPDVPVSVSSAFTTWYASAASNAFGSQFTMTVPFSFNGPLNLVTLQVTLTNSVGTSASAAPQ